MSARKYNPNVRSMNPLRLADSLWQRHSFTEQRSLALGQRMTPGAVARVMAALPSSRRKHVELLDPGAGLGALTAAYVTRILSQRGSRVERVMATAVEVDSLLLGDLRQTLEACKDACTRAGVDFRYRIVTDEFVSSTLRLLPKGELAGRRFDCILMNPPYAKLNVATATYRLLLDQGVRVTNWYAAFVVAALAVLADGGDLVAITPRSFCNGTYFRPFRRAVLTATSIERIHVFGSRTAAFKRDDVLQETVVFHARRAAQGAEVALANSATPLQRPCVRMVPFSRIVRPKDPELFIHLPLTDDGARDALRATASLTDLGLAVSTGPVVDFRLKTDVLAAAESGSVPLIYPMNFAAGRIRWPKASARKGQWISRSPDSARYLLPNRRYVLVKRFSTKEEPRRVSAAVYEPIGDTSVVGLENHLNYFHAHGHGLDRDLAWGLALYLNSSFVDRAVREFSGHTQVNAGDLRSLRYPAVDDLRELGHGVSEMPSQAEIDARLSESGVVAA